jgi:hypothetical protein
VLERWTHLSFTTVPPAAQQCRANKLINPIDYETLNNGALFEGRKPEY